MEVEVNGVVYGSEDARFLCEGCVARHNIGLCADISAVADCKGIIWIKKLGTK